MKELSEKNYERAEYWFKELLKTFPKSYSIRCILGYTYRCLKKYDEALLYLKEAINLKENNPVAWYICGEIFFRQHNYQKAIDDLEKSKKRIREAYREMHQLQHEHPLLDSDMPQ